MVSENATTVEEYKEEVRTHLETMAQEEYEYTLKASAWNAVLENTEVLVWPESVDESYNEALEQYKSFADMYAMDYEEFITSQMGTSVEEFEAEMYKQVQTSEKEMLVTAAIAEEEKIELTDELYEEQLAVMATLYGYEDAEAIKQAAEEEELREIALAFLVMDFVVDNCVQVAQ